MLYTEDFSVFIFIRWYLICFLVKTAFAISLKKWRKRKNNVFLRGNCFRFIRFFMWLHHGRRKRHGVYWLQIKQQEEISWQKEKQVYKSKNVLPAVPVWRSVRWALFLFIKDFTQMSAWNVWAAADVLRLVPRRSLKCRRWHHDKEEKMVWLFMNRFRCLFDFGLFQYPFCMDGAAVLLYSAADCHFWRR